jgi:hypothetical protein
MQREGCLFETVPSITVCDYFQVANRMYPSSGALFCRPEDGYVNQVIAIFGQASLD